ncbi:MAG: hypothetical protein RL367_699 [Pseudomonadota bacterium]
MTTTLDQLNAKVRSQKTALPSLYGAIDFDATPERFADQPDDISELTGSPGANREMWLADKALVARIKSYTMLGDATADAYAALMPQQGFKPLVEMLTTACDKGIEAVADAPPELVALIREMERVPDWLDRGMVERGARADRSAAALLSPYAIRGAFIATFMNKYSALPMALTGTLSHATAARRVKETATFFTTSVLPGALERFGPGFKAAAMVRLMHSMVRANVLGRPGLWDAKTYGIPIPQLDQMPAGLIPVYFMSAGILAKGRTRFTPRERAKVELARYRCYLLGLPEDLLGDTPQAIVKIWCTRSATLRREFDDVTCGGLLRATMEAELSTGTSLGQRLFRRLEHSFARIFFVKVFLKGDAAAAERIGVTVTATDSVLFALTNISIIARMSFYLLAERIPGLRNLTDRRLVAKLQAQLAEYGHAEFTSNAANYRPAIAGHAQAA